LKDRPMKYLLSLVLLASLPLAARAGDITRVWLTHNTNDPSRIVVSWMSDKPGDSVVQFGPTADYGQTIRKVERTTLHHVEIPLTEGTDVYHYTVRSGDQRSADFAF